MTSLTEAVLSKDISSSDIAKRQGAAAVAELTPLLAHADAQVRLTAVFALGEIADAGAWDLLWRATADSDTMVAVTAAEKLEPHARQFKGARFADALRTADVPTARKRLLLTWGRVATEQDLAQVADYCRAERSDMIAPACEAVLARLGQEAARKAFAERLGRAQDGELRDTIEMARYIDQPWVLAHLAPLLSRKEPLQQLGVEIPGFPTYLRTCDVAVSAIVAIGGATFSFPTDRHRNYDDAQLAEVHRFALSRR